MKRKRIINSAAWLSLIVFLILASLWIRSLWHIDQLTYVTDRSEDHPRFFAISSSKGRLGFLTAPDCMIFPKWYETSSRFNNYGGRYSENDVAGIKWMSSFKLRGAWFTAGPVPISFDEDALNGPRFTYTAWPPKLLEFDMPLWPLIILAGIMPAVRAVSAVRAARMAHCPTK